RESWGLVILPVESAAVPINCKAKKPEPRPVRKLQLVQTLDERQADKGKLLLEIKGTAVGLVGPLEDLLAIDVPEFEIKKIDDNGVNVSKFDEDGESIAIVSERSWTIALETKEGLTELPKEFRFAAAKIPVDEMLLQRYQDADVQTVASTIALQREYGKRAWNWKPWAIGGALGVVAFLAAA